MELGVLDKPSFEESLRELAARRLAAEGHPTPEDLAAYQAGELGTDQRERIKDHLAICEDCSRLLLDLAEFERFEPARESIAPVDARAEASWQRLRERLKEEAEERGEVEREEEHADEAVPILKPFPSRRRMPIWRRPALPWALAAGLALCVAGLGMRMGSLERQVEDLAGPKVVRTVSLSSEDDVTRGEGDAESPVRAGARVGYDLLLPSDPSIPSYPLYSVEIVSAAGGAAPVPVGRERAVDGLLRVVLPSAPEAGDYFFQVSGVRGEKETPVGRYPFKILPVQP
jgi:hypothetical protein